MADPRSIHEFTTGEVEATTLLLGDFVDLDAQSGYTTLKMSVSDIGEVILEDIEYTQDLKTTDKTIVGAINENKSVIGYSYDEYDATTAYSKDDLCIYNNTLYKAKQATTGNLPTNTTYWEQTSIADDISELKSNSDINVTYNKTSFVNGYIKRNNNVVCLSLVLLATENISNNDTIISNLPLPDSNNNLRIWLPTGNSQWQPSDFTSQCASVITQGAIGVIGSITSGKYIFIDATYICK